MKKMILFFIAFSYLSIAFAGGEVQNGGGGVVVSGRYMTFYSAKIPVGPTALWGNQIPGLDYLLNRIKFLEISEKNKTELIKVIYPTKERAYYAVDGSRLDSDLKKSLIKKYSELMEISEENTALFALTNIQSGETFLLPEFYALSEIEQATILFHEALWALKIGLTYKEVMVIEQDSQAFFEDSLSKENFYRFYSHLSYILIDPRLPLLPSLSFDQKNRFLSSTLDFGKLNLRETFGEAYIQCSLGLTPQNQEDACTSLLYLHLVEMRNNYPNSVFIASMLDYLDFSKGRFVSFYVNAKNFNMNEHSFVLINTATLTKGRLTLSVVDSAANIVGSIVFF